MGPGGTLGGGFKGSFGPEPEVMGDTGGVENKHGFGVRGRGLSR
jgi:hypothetical protein